MRGGRCLIVAVVGMLSCGGSPPTYTTAFGIQVWDPARRFSPEQVDTLTQLFVDEFPNRWPPAKVREQLKRAEIDLLDVHTYEASGMTVAGTTDPQSLRMTVAARDFSVSNSALAHELVHYLDLAITGTTDVTHASWDADGTYACLARVRQEMRQEEQAAPERIMSDAPTAASPAAP